MSMAGQPILYVGGPILTMQDDAPDAEALLTQGEKIIAVGSEADVRAQMPEGCEVVDLAGKTLMPAFIDPHGHFPDPGFNALYRVDLAVMDALKAQTIDAAWQVFQEGTRGSLAPGKLADLVVLSRNPVETPETIADICVERTIRRGRVVYDA